MSFLVVKPGFLTLVQDLGRYGVAHLGLARAGVMDQHASRWANYLLNNKQTDAVLEITLGGCELEAQANTIIAVTGAEMGFQINGQLKTNWQTYRIKAGDRLSWANATQGTRAYLAVKAGLQTETYFLSRSVNVREHVGRSVSQGDSLAYQPCISGLPNRMMPGMFKPDYSAALTLRLLPSYQFDLFSEQQKNTFFKQLYRVSTHADRVGYRLDGEPIIEVPEKMISEGMAYGSVEITSAGLPIILMNDAPTMGGYPKIGTVFSLDLYQLAQRQANTAVNFELLSIDQAQQYAKTFLHFFD